METLHPTLRAFLMKFRDHAYNTIANTFPTFSDAAKEVLDRFIADSASQIQTHLFLVLFRLFKAADVERSISLLNPRLKTRPLIGMASRAEVRLFRELMLDLLADSLIAEKPFRKSELRLLKKLKCTVARAQIR